MVDYRDFDDDDDGMDETVAGEMVLDEEDGGVRFVAAQEVDVSLDEDSEVPAASPFSQPMSPPPQAMRQAAPVPQAAPAPVRQASPQPAAAQPAPTPTLTRKPRPVAMDSGFQAFDTDIRSLMGAPTLNLVQQRRSSGATLGIVIAVVVCVLAIGFIFVRFDPMGLFGKTEEVAAPKGMTWSLSASPAGIEVFYENRYVGEIPCSIHEETEKPTVPLKFVAGDKTYALTLPGMAGEMRVYLKDLPGAESVGWRRVVAPPPAVALRDDIIQLGTTPLIVVGPAGQKIKLGVGEGRTIEFDLLSEGGDFSVY